MKARIRRYLAFAKTPSEEVTRALETSLQELTAIRQDNAALRAEVAQLASAVSALTATTEAMRVVNLTIGDRARVTEEIVTWTKELLLGANHQINTTARKVDELDSRQTTAWDRLHAQITAEREATLASNDGTRRNLTALADQLAEVTRTLEDVITHQRAVPHIDAAARMLEHAEEIVDVARSQYTESIPRDATAFASVTP